MKDIGDVWRTVDQEIHLAWQRTRSWMERAFSEERIVDIAVLLCVAAVLAAVLFALHNTLQNNTIVEISPYLSPFRSSG